MADPAYRVLNAFKVAALSETRGLVADLNATVGDVDVYSLTNTHDVRILATSHARTTAERIRSLRPSRPVVDVAVVDLGRPCGALQLQHCVANRSLAAAFWRIERADDVARAVALLAAALTHDGIVYFYALDRTRIRELLLCHELSVFGDTVRTGEHARSMPDFAIDDIDGACRAAGLAEIFDESLDATADRIGVNILPNDRRLCQMHRIRAYQRGVNFGGG